jgi:hypothetical protein
VAHHHAQLPQCHGALSGRVPRQPSAATWTRSAWPPGQQLQAQSHLQNSVATLASTDYGGTEQQLSLTSTSQIPTLHTTAARILTRSWPSTRRKKDKYAEACLVRRRTFTPLMFAVDGLRGTEASAATKKLALRLSAKWKRTYSKVCCGFVRSRLLITLVQTTSLCFRGSRDPTAQANHATWDSGVGLALY